MAAAGHRTLSDSPGVYIAHRSYDMIYVYIYVYLHVIIYKYIHVYVYACVSVNTKKPDERKFR